MPRVQPSPSPTAIELAGPAMIDVATPVGEVGPWGLVPAWVLQAKDPRGRGLSGADLRVYVALRTYADRDGKAFPQVQTISHRADVSQRAAERAVGRLRDLGLLTSTRRYRGDGSISGCDYTLVDVQPEATVMATPWFTEDLEDFDTSAILAPVEVPRRPSPTKRVPSRGIPRQAASPDARAPRPVARNIKNRRTCVYRHFDAGGTLLYVGITNSSSRRESGHLLNSIWHGMSASRTEEWFPNRTDAEAAEVKAIKDEEPLFNIEGNASTRALLRVRRYLEARDLGALWEIHRRRVEFGQRPEHTRKAKAPTGKVLGLLVEE